jgi:hypothetical protein
LRGWQGVHAIPALAKCFDITQTFLPCLEAALREFKDSIVPYEDISMLTVQINRFDGGPLYQTTASIPNDTDAIISQVNLITEQWRILRGVGCSILDERKTSNGQQNRPEDECGTGVNLSGLSRMVIRLKREQTYETHHTEQHHDRDQRPQCPVQRLTAVQPSANEIGTCRTSGKHSWNDQGIHALQLQTD